MIPRPRLRRAPNDGTVSEQMSYAVKEIFYTLQGEGALTGRPAVFCRFAGCNLWSGREEDRAGAVCTFCDTDFVGMDGTEGGRYADAEALAEGSRRCGPEASAAPVCRLHRRRAAAAARSAADRRRCTRAASRSRSRPTARSRRPAGIDWVCVSPKAGAPLVVTAGDELKIVVPQAGLDPLDFAELDFRRFSVQPMDGPERARNTELAIAFCLAHPQWQLSLQTHKLVGFR